MTFPRALVCLVLCSLLAPAMAPAGNAAIAASTDRFVIRFGDGVPALAPGADWHGMRVNRVDEALGFAVVEVRGHIVLPPGFRDAWGVVSIERDVRMNLIGNGVEGDPHTDDQYGLREIRAPAAWNVTRGDPAVGVCVVDTGVRTSHEDLQGARYLGGVDVVNGDNDPWDDNGHGTHVAGIVAATAGNGKGIEGVAQVGYWAVKVVDAQGSGTGSDFATGIRWCADQGADVISVSLGGPSGPSVLTDAVRYASEKGSLIVAAAGNSGCGDCIGYPAAYEEVMAVGCTDRERSLCSYSSRGPQAELAAPGDDILSTGVGGDAAYEVRSGTSMSTPHVSGVAALALSVAPDLTNTQVRRLLVDTARDLGPEGRDSGYGYGLVDAAAAVDLAANGGPTPETEVYRETFDTGGTPSGWQLSGLWHVTHGCGDAASPAGKLAYARAGACDYDTGARTTGSAQFEVDLADASAATLHFSHRWVTESYGGNYDRMRVQASDDGGATWSTLTSWNSRDANRADWHDASASLDAYVGGTVQVRFHFDSVDKYGNAHEGWRVDDVRVTARVPGGGGGGGGASNHPPVARAGGDVTVSDTDASGDEAVTLDGSASRDPDGTLTGVAWMRDGVVFSRERVATVTLPVGVHDVTLRVTDDAGATATDTARITVEANRAPTAAFEASCDGRSCSFDATASGDPDGTLKAYAWKFGDGTTGNGRTVTHAFGADGTYTVRLTVTDDGGATDEATRSVTVREAGHVLLAENFDDGKAQGWRKSHSSTDLWRLASDCTDAASGSRALAFSRSGPACDYDVGRAAGWAATPTVDASGSERLFLEFSHKWRTEQANGPYDRMRVQVSSDGGTSWTTVRVWDARDANQLDWATETVDVSEHASANFRVRFHFDSGDRVANAYLGWWVDDVRVRTG